MNVSHGFYLCNRIILALKALGIRGTGDYHIGCYGYLDIDSFLADSGIIRQGAFRTVLIPHEEDFIIKFDRRGNQCENEKELFFEVKDTPYGKYFVPYLCTYRIDDYIFYVFKKVLCERISISSKYQSSQNEAKVIFNERWTVNRQMSASVILAEEEGTDQIKKLYEFLRVKVSDLHSGNIGIDPDSGKYVITDYGMV